MPDRPDPAFDVLGDVIARIRLDSTLYFSAEARGDWGLHAAPAPRAPFYLVRQGECLIGLGDGAPEVRLGAGDLAIVTAATGHTLRAHAGAPVLPFAEFTRRWPMDAAGFSRIDAGPGPVSAMIGGFFALTEIAGNPLLAVLPPLVHLRAADPEVAAWLLPLGDSIAQAMAQPRAGMQALLSRLADALFIQAVRAEVARPGAPQGWLRGLADPPVARALALLHADPGRAWTLALLARAAATSRTRLAARFTAATGEAPMAYLARWRLLLAAQRLAASGAPIAVVAEEAGYASEQAFSRAFRRRFGAPPGAWRMRAPA